MEIIEKIRKEIERRYNKHKYATSITEMVYAEEDESILAFLDSLQAEASYDTQKYAPTPSVDIGDVARVQFASHAKVFDKKRKAVFDWEQFKEVAGIFYGFGKKDSLQSEEKETPKLEEAANKFAVPYDQGTCDGIAQDCFIAGAEWQAEQFAKIVRANLTEIGNNAQSQFEQFYFEITGTKMYGGYND